MSYCPVIANNYLSEDLLDDKVYLLHLYTKIFLPRSKRVASTELKIKHGLKLVKVKFNISEQELCEKLEEIIQLRTKNEDYINDKELLTYLKYSISLHKELLPLSDALIKIDEELNTLGFQKELREIAKIQQTKPKVINLPKFMSSRSPDLLIIKE